MRKIPWKTIALVSLIMALLVVARSAVTVGKAFYYGYDWVAKLVEDPWFIVGIIAAAVGVLSLIILGCLQKKAAPAAAEAPREAEMSMEEAFPDEMPPETE